MPLQPKSAWLVTYEGVSAHSVEDAGKILTVISARRSESFVKDVAIVLYRQLRGGAFEHFVEIDRSTRDLLMTPPLSGSIMIGNNPFVFARQVSEFSVKLDEDSSEEVVSWKEPDVWSNDPTTGRLQKTRTGQKKTVRRPRFQFARVA